MAALVTELVSDLSQEERMSAAAWLACPLHNQRAVLLALFNQQCREPEQEPELCWADLYPAVPFQLVKWDLLKSDLLRCLEDWLSYRQWKFSVLPRACTHSGGLSSHPSGVVRPSLLEAYRERGLNRHLKIRLKRAEKALLKRPSPEFEEVLRWQNTYEALPGLEADPQAIDFALVRSKLRAACQTISSLRLKEQALEIPLLQECLALAAYPPYSLRPGIAPYRLAVLLLLEPGQAEQHFEELRDQWFNKLNYYPLSEQRDLLRIGLNYCVGRINAGDQDYLQTTLDLYRLALKRKLVYDGGYISPFTFDNIVGIALRLGEDDWAEAFLQTEGLRLAKELQAPIIALNTARLALNRKDYNGILIALRSSDFPDFIHQLAARTLQLKAYRALQLDDLLSTHLQNTRALLRRKHSTSYHVTNYRNIFNLAIQLVRLSPGDEKGIERLKTIIDKTEPLTERTWLLSQLC